MTFQIQTRNGQATGVPDWRLPSVFEKLQRRRLFARVLRMQVQGVRGLRHVVHEDRRKPRRGKRTLKGRIFTIFRDASVFG